MPVPRILLVSDDSAARSQLLAGLAAFDYRIAEAATSAVAHDALADGTDLVVIDGGFGGGDSAPVELIQSLRGFDTELPIILLADRAKGEDEAIILRAIREGAVHVCPHDVPVSDVAMLIDGALDIVNARRESDARKRFSELSTTPDSIIGTSAATEALRRELCRLGESTALTIALTGETGTGKELAARVIHACSDRAAFPMISVACTAIGGARFESELFGHEPGAFPGARTRVRGLFEVANGGTVYLDEVAELPAVTQGRLVRLLQEGTIRRMGGSADIDVDVRIVAGTSRDLDQMVAEHVLREDLCRHLKRHPLRMPSLRERAEDVAPLARHFSAEFGRLLHKPVSGISAPALEQLARYDWPGNIRELRNAVERAVLLAEAPRLHPTDFLPGASSSCEVNGLQLPPEGLNLEDVERLLVLQALERTHGNQTRAGRLLGLNRDQVRYRVQKFGIDLATLSGRGR